MSLLTRKLTAITILISILLTVFPAVSGFAAESDVSFEFEAEKYIVSGGNGKEFPDAMASGSTALKGTATVADSPEASATADVIFSFEVSKEDVFTLWFRGKVPGSSGDSVWISIDDNEYTDRFMTETGEEYKWFAFSTETLSLGTHSMNIIFREPDFYLDKVLITSDNDYLPDGNPYSTPDFKPSKRPRVMINAESLEKAKANLLTGEHKEIYEEVKTNAALSTKGVFQNSFTYDVAASYIEGNAFLYLISGDEINGRNAIEGLFEHYSSTDHKTSQFTYRSAGYEIYLSAIVYDWCYDLLKEEEKEKIYNKVIENCQMMEIGWPPVKQNGTGNSHEGEYQVMRDMLSFAIASYEDYPQFYNVVMGKILDEYIPMNNYFYENTSFHNQGDSYGMYRYTAEMYMKYLMTAIGKGELISDKQHMMAYHFIMRRRPDGAHMQDGDMFNLPLTGYIPNDKPSFLAGNFYNDPYLRNEYYRNDCELRNNQDEISAVTYLLLNKPEVGTKDNAELPLTWYAGDQQAVMTARTSWDEGINSNTMMVSMKVSEYITRSHQHLDSGNFEIYYKGPLALDSGVYNGYIYDENGEIKEIGSGSDHDVNYHHRTIAHNAMLVYDPNEKLKMGTANDGGQRAVAFPDQTRTFNDVVNDEEFKYGDVLSYDYGEDLYAPSYSYLEGDLTKAYTDKVTDYSRAFMFFNFFDETYPGALVVFDRVEAKDATFEKTWLLHSEEEPVVSENITTIRRTEHGYNGRLINETLLPKMDNLSIKKVGGVGEEYSVRGVNYPAYADGDIETGKWRVEVSPKEDSKSDYFLNVLQVADNTLNPEPLESTYLETDDLIGVQIKDRVAYFGKSKERTSDNLAISGNGADNLIYTICGLSAGEWQVSGDDYNLTVTATKEGGVISFTAPGGEYTLTKLSDNAIAKKFDLLSNTRPLNYIKPILKADGYYFDFKAKPYIKNNEIYVPAKEAAAFLRDDAVITEGDSDIEIVYSGNIIKFIADENKAVKNGNEHIITHIPEFKNNALYVPLYLLKEFLNINADSDAFTNITEFSDGRAMYRPVISEIDNTFVSKDGIESAAFSNIENYSELNVMEYGMLLSPLPNGVIGGENTVVYKADKANNKEKSGKFGIHLKDYFLKLAPSYYLRPYMIYDNNGSLTTVYAGSGQYIDRYSAFENGFETEEVTIMDAITDDTCSRTNYDTAGNYAPTGEWSRVTLYNGIPINDASGNNQLHRYLVKINLDALTDADFSKPILLNVTGVARFVEKTETAPDSMTVDVYGTYDYEWSESIVSAAGSSVGPNISEILEMDKIGDFTVDYVEPDVFVEKTVDISKFARKAISAGKSEITVILFADNSSRVELSRENGRDGLYFQMGTRENTSNSRKPKVTYNKFVAPKNTLSGITLDGTALADFDSGKTSYTISYSTENFPVVSATAEDSAASVNITQADEVNKTAVIMVTDKNNLISRAYKIEFVKELPSTLTEIKTPVCADTNSKTNQYEDWYSPNGQFMQVNVYNGVKMDDSGNGKLQRAMIKIDLTELEGVDLSKDIFLNIKGRYQFNKSSLTANPPVRFTVNAYGTYDYEWSESSVNSSASSVGPGISEILEMKNIASFKVPVPTTSTNTTGAWITKSMNIKELVVEALSKGRDYITVILLADNDKTERADSIVTDNDNNLTDNVAFQIATKEYEEASYQPRISYYKYD